MMHMVVILLVGAHLYTGAARDSWLRSNLSFTSETKHNDWNIYEICNMSDRESSVHPMYQGRHSLRHSDRINGGKHKKYTR
jgi:hypothetical protein